MFSALRFRPFRLYWVGLAVSNLGAWMQIFAFGLLVVDLAARDGHPEAAALYLGVLGLARAVPAIMLLLPIGAFIEKYDRRRLLLRTQSLGALCALAQATLVLTDHVHLAPLLLLAFLGATVLSFDSPTRASFYPQLVGRAQTMSAIGLNATAFSAPQIVGPLLGALVLSRLGIGGIMLINALSYGALISALLAIGRVLPPHVVTASSRSSIRLGLAHIHHDPVLRWALILTGVVAFTVGPFSALLPAIAVQSLPVGPSGLGLLLSAVGVGALVGGLATALLGRVAARGRVYLGVALLSALALGGFSLAHTLPLALLLAALIGALNSMFNALTNGILQSNAPRWLHGRASAVNALTYMGLLPLGQFVLGALASLVGIGPVLVLGALLLLGTLLFLALQVPALHELEHKRVLPAHVVRQLRWELAAVAGARSALRRPRVTPLLSGEPGD